MRSSPGGAGSEQRGAHWVLHGVGELETGEARQWFRIEGVEKVLGVRGVKSSCVHNGGRVRFATTEALWTV